jgi:chromate transporter
MSTRDALSTHGFHKPQPLFFALKSAASTFSVLSVPSVVKTAAVIRATPKALHELACLFLKLGIIGFGGPAAHIAMMEDEVVRRRQWLTREAFLDLVGATNLIPGPNSTEMAIHIGRIRAGTPGLIVAGVCFILPAMLLVMGCAWLYVKFGSLPQAGALLRGIHPVIIAIVAQALWSLGRTAIKSSFHAILGILVALAALGGLDELLLLFSAALAAMIARRPSPDRQTIHHSIGPVPVVTLAITSSAAVVPYSLPSLFLFFLKVGSVLFGSGYVLLAFLRADLVERWHWLSEPQLLDAIAIGQITPGPVFTTATFIGYLLGGVPGSILATVGIFLPAFFFVAISAPYIARLRASPVAGAFLDGLNVASLALMAVVTGHLAHGAIRDVPTLALAAISVILLIRYRLNSAWLVLAGAAAAPFLPT